MKQILLYHLCMGQLSQRVVYVSPSYITQLKYSDVAFKVAFVVSKLVLLELSTTQMLSQRVERERRVRSNRPWAFGQRISTAYPAAAEVSGDVV